MKEMKEWAQRYVAGRISRREFVERASAMGFGLLATEAVLAQVDGKKLTSEHHHHSDQHGQHEPKKQQNRNQTNINPYEEWLKAEGIPVYRDYGIKSLRTLELKPWKRLDASGAYIDLKGGEGVNDAYVLEIPPRGKTTVQRYLFEEVVYVLSGEGEAAIWNNGGSKQTVRWKPGSIVAPPLNTNRQYFNLGDKPARLLSITNGPVVIDLFNNTDFVLNNDYVFRDRYNGETDFFGTGPEKLYHKDTSSEESEIRGGVFTWDSGFVPDARNIGLKEVKERGAGNSRIELQLADNTMQAHISEFAVGTYKKAHRHGPGSHVVMLNGAGYTLMWKGTPKFSEVDHVRLDWNEASLFVPPDGWFHQHFNGGGDPARYLAATWGGDGKWFNRAIGGGGRTHRLGKTSIRKGGNLIEYEDEDPVIREIFEAELKKNNVESRMSKPKKEASDE